MGMRIEGHSNVGTWFLRVFPKIPPREIGCMNQTCYRVRCPEQTQEAQRFAYWSYLERQAEENAVDVDVTPRPPGRFTPMKPTGDAETPEPRFEPTGLGGAPLGDVPPPKAEQLPPPKPGPHQIARIREPGYLGSIIDIIT